MLNSKPKFIVFSSHKTGTQSITGSLNASGYNAAHCHLLENFNIAPEELITYLRRNLEENGEKIVVISTFRLPIERHISSFFQCYGSKILQSLPSFRPSDTVIAKASIEALNALFIADLATRRLAGYKESLHQIFEVLKINSAHIESPAQSESRGSFSLVCEHPLATLHLLRFTELFQDFPAHLTSAMGIPITSPQEQNIASKKWYASKYDEFKQSVRLPQELIEETYCHRQELIELFYPGQFLDLLSADKQRYGYIR